MFMLLNTILSTDFFCASNGIIRISPTMHRILGVRSPAYHSHYLTESSSTINHSKSPTASRVDVTLIIATQR